jgi:hypothetical protein
MNLKKEIFERISSIEKVELSETKKIELGLIQDIQADLNTWVGATNSVKTAINQLITKLIKDNTDLRDVFAAIDKVERAAAELGVDNVVKDAQSLRKQAIAISGSLLKGADKLKEALSVL